MRRSSRPIVIASRRSLLARVQAQAVGRALQRLHPHVDLEFRWIESEGDQQTERSLASSGGKGLFARAVERALLDGEADVAVHSLKDLPTQLTPGLAIAAIPRRGDARDCLIAADAATIEDLPHAAVVGTASPRRSAQLLRLRPDLQVVLLRGNIETRLRKVLEERLMAATLLSAAGLQRASLGQYADKPIDPEQMLPAAGQGALAIQCRMDDHVATARCLPLNDPAASAAVHFERRVVDGLAGSCHSPIAAYAQPTDPGAATFALRALVLSPDGVTCLEAPARHTAAGQLASAAAEMVQALLDQGAAAVLHAAAAGAVSPSASHR